MDDDFGILAFLSAALAVFAFAGRIFQFVVGLLWLLSPKHRKAWRKDRRWPRFFVFEGVGLVALIAVLALVGLGIAIASHVESDSPKQSVETTRGNQP